MWKRLLPELCILPPMHSTPDGWAILGSVSLALSGSSERIGKILMTSMKMMIDENVRAGECEVHVFVCFKGICECATASQSISALRLESWEFHPRRVIPKTVQMGTMHLFLTLR
jgi:hypothetical protein